MTIYTKEQIIETLKDKTKEELETAFIRLLKHKTCNPTRLSLYASVLTRSDLKTKPKEMLCSLGDGVRYITYEQMMELNASPMIDYVKELVEAVYYNEAKFMNREAMMSAANIKGSKCFYLTPTGIPQKYKNHAGYILTMAGFCKGNSYDPERKQPFKTWRRAHGTARWTLEERIERVHATIMAELDKFDRSFKEPLDSKPTTPNLESFL